MRSSAAPALPGTRRSRAEEALPAGTGRSPIRPNVRTHRTARRAWRRRGRRAQVSAIATMFGLLLIVTMVATYLSTQLPSQMRLNEQNHAIQVENQIERLGASLQQAAAAGAIGAMLSQPLSLGSAGAPPFAPPDGSSVAPGPVGSRLSVSYNVTYSGVTTPQTSSGAIGATFAVTLRNTYASNDIEAYDQGAIVYAQPTGHPIMLVGPGLSYSGGTLNLWIPEFVGNVGTEVGIGTAELTALLVSVLNVTLPSNGYSLSGSVVLSVTTPYAEAWWSYLNTTLPTLTKTCAPAGSIACDGEFELAGPLGTVTLTVPATALSIQTATFSVTLS